MSLIQRRCRSSVSRMTTTLLPFASLCPNIHHGRLAVSGFSSRHVVRLVPRSTFSTRAKKTALYPEGAYGQIADEKFMCSSLLPSVPWVRMVTSNGGSETHLLSGVHRLNSTFRSNTRMRLTEMRQGLPFLQQRNQVFQERLSSSSLTTLNNTRHQPEDERGTAKSCVKENILSELSLLDRRKSMDIIVFDRKSTLILIGAQGLLILASVAVAMILNIPNFGLGSNFVFDTTSVFVGVIATLPLFGLAFVLDIVESYVPALREVTMATQRSVLALLGERRKPLVAILTSIALGIVAGIGEEMLFRGVLQTQLTTRLFPVSAAVGVTSVIFGALHAVTPLYALLASLASVFFGMLYVQSGSNLAVPIVCHGLYDIGALLWAHYVVTGMDDDERAMVADWRPKS